MIPIAILILLTLFAVPAVLWAADLLHFLRRRRLDRLRRRARLDLRRARARGWL